MTPTSNPLVLIHNSTVAISDIVRFGPIHSPLVTGISYGACASASADFAADILSKWTAQLHRCSANVNGTTFPSNRSKRMAEAEDSEAAIRQLINGE